MPLGPVAHTKLDAEIEADTDKQRCERDRDQTERADHQQAKGRRSGQSDEQKSRPKIVARQSRSASLGHIASIPDPGEAEGIRIFRARAASYKACMAVACKCASVDDRVLAVRCSTHLMTVG